MSIIFVNKDIDIAKILSDEGLNVMDTVENAMISFKDYNYYHVIFSDSELEFSFLSDYDRIYPELNKQIKKCRNKYNCGLLPIGSSMAYSLNYKHNIICSVIMNTEYSDITDTKNLYYAIKAMLEVWPEEGFLIVNTNNISIDVFDAHQIVNSIRDYNRCREVHELNFNTLYIPGYNQVYESNLEQPESYYSIT